MISDVIVPSTGGKRSSSCGRKFTVVTGLRRQLYDVTDYVTRT